MNVRFDRHFPEEVWEEYAMGTRGDQDCKLLEGHLLVCSACQDLLAEVDDYLKIAKTALSRTRRRLSKSASAALVLAVGLHLLRLA